MAVKSQEPPFGENVGLPGSCRSFVHPSFAYAQVVLSHTDVELLDLPFRAILPGGQAHVLFFGIGTVDDDLRRRLAVDGPVQLLRHGGEESFGGPGGEVISEGSRFVMVFTVSYYASIT